MSFSHLKEGDPAICGSPRGLEGMVLGQLQMRTDIVCSLSLWELTTWHSETETVVTRLGGVGTCWSEGTCFPLDLGSV